MKNFLSVFLLYMLCAIPVSAALTTEDSTSTPYLENHGYSGEMVRLINLQNKQINGDKSKYKSSDPTWYTEDKKVNLVRKIFMYFDPGLDDQQFMQHDIKYSNSYDDINL